MNEAVWLFDGECRRRESLLRQKDFDAYCLFCMSGSEVRLAQEINCLNPECLAMPFLRMMHRSRNGERYLVQDVLLKGYVFLFVPEQSDIALLRKGETCFRVLERKRGGGLLIGDDRRYANWVLERGGILEVSQAARINDRVKIVSGPLLDLEGYITAFSKKNRNCRVLFEIMGRQLDVWLPFDWVESAESISL